MRERFIYDEDQTPIRKTPVLEMETRTTLGMLDLDHVNTKLRLFGEGFYHMNHVEYRNRKGEVTGILLGQFISPDVSEQLVELGYPHSFDPAPPQEDLLWYDRAFLLQHNIKPDILEVAPKAEAEFQESESEPQPGFVGLAVSSALSGVAVVSAISSMIINKIR